MLILTTNERSREKILQEPFIETAKWVSKGRVPCLDGFRALAIIAVVLSHLAPQIQAQVGYRVPLPSGHLGVTFFFVISGFLITLLMLRESQRTGTVSLKDFYIRRTLRIFPAYFFYLGVILLCQALGVVSFAWQRWAAAATYTMCLMPNLSSAWELGHLWSLSVEEHFYLLWPLLFCLAKPVKAFRVLLVYLLLLPFLRYTIWVYGKFYSLDIDFCSPTQMGSIGMGCVAAFAVSGMAFHVKIADLLRKQGPWLAGGSLALLAVSQKAATLSGKYEICLGDPINAFCLMVFMVSALYMEKSLLFRIMNWKPLVAVGILSYSIYLWQQPLSAKGFAAGKLPLWPLNVVFILGFALASYYLVETPFLRWKEKRKGKMHDEGYSETTVPMAPISLLKAEVIKETGSTG